MKHTVDDNMKRDLIKLLYMAVSWYVFALVGVWAIGACPTMRRVLFVWFPTFGFLVAMYAIFQNAKWLK